MPAVLKVFGASVPIAAISLDALGERIVLVAAVIGSMSLIWAKVLRPIVQAAHRVIAGYHMLAELPDLVESVQHIEQKFDELERVGEIVDMARDENVREVKDALRLARVEHDTPQ